MKKELYIKNMVCDRCIRVVKEELEKIGLEVTDIRLGKVTIGNGEDGNTDQVDSILRQNGFELLINTKVQLIEKIKTVIVQLIQGGEIENLHSNISDYISEVTGHEYPYLSHLFSSVESITIEKYFILQRIEKVKELLAYNELTLSEIAPKLGYANVQYLSSQFKKITGMTPSSFKKLTRQSRVSLDKLKA